MSYVDEYESRHDVRTYSRIGRRAPLPRTAVAKVLLAAARLASAECGAPAER